MRLISSRRRSPFAFSAVCPLPSLSPYIISISLSLPPPQMPGLGSWLLGHMLNACQSSSLGFILLKSGQLPPPSPPPSFSWKQLAAVCHCPIPVFSTSLSFFPVPWSPLSLSLIFGCKNMLPTFWHHSYIYCGDRESTQKAADNLTIFGLSTEQKTFKSYLASES